MRTFIRLRNGKVTDRETNQFVCPTLLGDLLAADEAFVLIDARTELDITKNTKTIVRKFKKYQRKKIKKAQEARDREGVDLGPSTPLNPVKYNLCLKCKAKTPNRYRCAECWGDLSHVNMDAAFIYSIF